MSTQADNETQMLTTTDAAKIIGVSAKTLHRWRQKGEGPLPVALPSGQFRYPSVYLEVWLSRRSRAA